MITTITFIENILMKWKVKPSSRSRIFRVITIFFVFYLFSCNSAFSLDYVPGELIVKFKDVSLLEQVGPVLEGNMIFTGDDLLDILIARHEVVLMAPLIYRNIYDISRIPGKLKNIYRIRFNPTHDVMEVMEDYLQLSNVEYAEPNYIYQTCYIPNDPSYGSQWAHGKIMSAAGWDYQQGNASTVIAIIDTGVDYNHVDLTDNMLPGYDFVDIDVAYWQNFYTLYPGEEDYTIFDNDPMDVVGHGTHTAGISSATTDNGVGIAGVAFNCSILPVRAGFKADSSGLFDIPAIANALYYAADQGAHVINMSFGGAGDSTTQRLAIEYAYSKGCVLVAASGNSGINGDNFYPAAYTQVISVGATNSSDQRASFSNYGNTLEVTAPGVSILSTLPGDQYASWNGTSMAAPHVAGLAALLRAKYPSASVENIRQFIRSSADDLGAAGFDIYYGYGRINLENALQPTAPQSSFLYVTYNDIGIWELNPNTGYGTQPVNGTFHVHVYHAASGDLDGDGNDELYVDFGSTDGIWMKQLFPEQPFVFTNIPVSLSVKHMFSADTDGDNVDELYIDGGTSGIFKYAQGTGFNSTPLPYTSGYTSMFGIAADMNGDGSDELYLDYGTLGVWGYDTVTGWSQREIPGTAGYTANWGSAGDIDGDGKDELYLDYGTLGIWKWNGSSWNRLPGTAGYQPTWGHILDGDNNGILEFYIDYGIEGIWKYSFTSGWNTHPVPMTAGDVSDFASPVIRTN